MTAFPERAHRTTHLTRPTRMPNGISATVTCCAAELWAAELLAEILPRSNRLAARSGSPASGPLAPPGYRSAGASGTRWGGRVRRASPR